MEEYLSLVEGVLRSPTYKPNRTAVDTLSQFNANYQVDLSEGYPLLTTKRMDDHRWDSMVHEFLWYLSGEEHIRNLREETPIWDEWADEEGHLDTAYGRFWRRYPIPDDEDRLPGESWADADNRWVREEDGRRVFDQLGYVVDTLTGDNPDKDASSRRMVVNAWHPANAAVSTLPPCHYTFVVNVQGDRLNVHLTQRSGDIALGIPFNIAAYSLLANVLAQRADLQLGSFGHTVVDAHVYCGTGERGAWYADHHDDLADRLAAGEDPLELAHWIESTAPTEPEAGYDHVPNLLRQLAREPLARPEIRVADEPLDELSFDDIELVGYESHGPLEFAVAE